MYRPSNAARPADRSTGGASQARQGDKRVTRRLVGAVALFVLACSAALSASFWETKPFTDWSDKEVLELLSDSPWSRRVRVVLNDAPGGRRSTPTTLTLTISWRSALPTKQALVRNQVGLDRPIPPDSQLILERQEDFYIVSLSGLPLSYSRATGTLKNETFLQPARREPISPSSTIIQPVKDTVMLLFAFPRTDAITLKDKEIEFVTRLGQIVIKKKFDLKSMVFHGELEL
jgi:hypothetical protein